VTAFAALAAWVYLLLWHGRFWESRPELAPMLPARAPDVAIVVPARDEAAVIAASIGSLLAQDYPGRFRVVLVDDGSTDGTGDIARALPGGEILRVLPGAARPAGWAGKPWAMAQGVAETDEEYVLLTDADIVHAPLHLATLVAQAEATGCDLVSEMVALNCTSAAERALVPAFVYFFQLLYPFARVNDGLRATAGAAGGTMLIRRRALDRIGGIDAIRDRLIDDCALAVAVKRGGRIWLGHSGLARSVRPYPRTVDIWRMVTRSAYVQLGYSPLLLLGTVLGLGLMFLAPVWFALFGHGWAQVAGALAWLGMAFSLQPTLRRYGRAAPWGLALPAIAVFYMAATVASAWNHHFGRGVVWKSRAYS
jgi:hopene-associated glycosyltransferase HpnB